MFNERNVTSMITSTSNSRVKKLRELMIKAQARRKEGVFIAEGFRMVSETPEERLAELYLSESFSEKNEDFIRDHSERIKPVVLSDEVFKYISDTKTPQGVLAIVKRADSDPESILHRESPFILFLENIQDPGNLGTIVRTAEAAGASGIIMSDDTVDIYNMKVVRATMGCLYRMPFAYADKDGFMDLLHMAKRNGIVLYAAYLDASIKYTDVAYSSSCGILIGNEGNGLSREAAFTADERIMIPMCGKAESLNAAMASGIIMYEVRRQRGY